MKLSLAALLGAAALFPVPAAAAPAPSDRAITDLPVSFDVVNRNGTAVPCSADGGRYTVRGHLTGPTAELGGPRDRPRTVIELLTGFDEGEWAWRFRVVPGYDFAMEMARLGFSSLTLDPLGYGSSDHPPGNSVCIGSHADISHQIVQQLRSGSYRVSGGEPVPFTTVIVSARDVGPVVAALEAHTWRDVDGISGQVGAHQGTQPWLLDKFARAGRECARGGHEWDEPYGTPPHGGEYVFVGPPDDQFRGDLFYEKRTDPRVIDAVIARRNTNPCGVPNSTVPAAVENRQHMPEIEVPVLLVFPGPDDPTITKDGQRQEAANYGGSDVTTAWMDSGHFMELEGCAPAYRALTAHWIHTRFGVGDDVPAPAVGPDECVTETDRPLAPAAPAARQQLRLSVSPRRVARRTPARFRFRVTGTGSSPLEGATVRFGNRRVTTGSDGRAAIALRFWHAGLKGARASLAGYRSATRRVRVVSG